MQVTTCYCFLFSSHMHVMLTVHVNVLQNAVFDELLGEYVEKHSVFGVMVDGK